MHNYTDNVLSCKWRSPGIKGNTDPTACPVDIIFLDLLLTLIFTYHPLSNSIAGLWQIIEDGAIDEANKCTEETILNHRQGQVAANNPLKK